MMKLRRNSSLFIVRSFIDVLCRPSDGQKGGVIYGEVRVRT